MKNNNFIKNFYNFVKEDKAVHNPGYKYHGLEVPFYGIILGGSGSGKTNLLLQYISLASNTYQKIVICLKTKFEPLYQLLENRCPEVEFYENGEIPDINEFDAFTSSLIVFDDLVLEKDQSKIQEYFIRGRKKFITCIYLSQSYYKIPKLIRINCRYIFILKLSSKKDLKMILNEHNLCHNIDKILDLYIQSTSSFGDFLNIDTKTDSFRKNFNNNI